MSLDVEFCKGNNLGAWGGGDRVGRWKEKKKEGEKEILADERRCPPKVMNDA